MYNKTIILKCYLVIYCKQCIKLKIFNLNLKLYVNNIPIDILKICKKYIRLDLKTLTKKSQCNNKNTS